MTPNANAKAPTIEPVNPAALISVSETTRTSEHPKLPGNPAYYVTGAVTLAVVVVLGAVWIKMRGEKAGLVEDRAELERMKAMSDAKIRASVR